MMYDIEIKSLYDDFVVGRHRIYLARQNNEPQPWTDNPVLASVKFTNVFRVLDPGSQFVLTDLFTTEPEDFITRCVFYRVTNLPKTWRMMRTALGRYPITYDFAGDADPITPLLAAYRSAGNTVFSGAYIIIPEPGTTFDKVEGAVRLTRRFVDTALDDFLDADDQETRFRVLRSVPGIGKFLAMQILTDWGYGATENPENDFIVAGPGAQRGALYLDPNTPAEEVIHRLTEEWDGQPTVRIGSHSLTLMDVQNTLCEFSKVMRYYDGKPVPKTLYRPAHPGPQPKPVLPVWVP